MSEDNYPIVYEHADGKAGNWKAVEPDPDGAVEALLDELPVGSEVTIVQIEKPAGTTRYRKRRLNRWEVAERLLEAAEEGPALIGQVIRDLGIRPDDDSKEQA